MADVELVIKIPQFLYKQILKRHVGKMTIAHIFKNATPLLKGHGRLKDVDYGLKNCKDEHEIEYWDKEVPTIIEADNGSEG